MTELPFKVIIVGGGVGGLATALSLERAGIDWILLEKGVVAPEWGTSITIQPNGCRILHQLGILEALEKKCTAMGGLYNRESTGRLTVHSNFFKDLESLTGYPSLSIKRQTFLETVLAAVQHPERIHEGCRVTSWREEKDRVYVRLEDGTEIAGDLLVGCDGVHSILREGLAQEEAIDASSSMNTEYIALISEVPQSSVWGLGPNHMHSTSFNDISLMMICQPDIVFASAYFKLPEHRRGRGTRRVRFNAAETEAFADQIAGFPVTESVRFGDLWKRRLKGQIVTLEEGVFPQWSRGRCLLLGDSAHKVTPNAGFGGSSAMESAVVLVNELRRTLLSHPEDRPSASEIQSVFETFDKKRRGRVFKLYWPSWVITRLQAYDGWLMYFVQRWLLPLMGLSLVSRMVSYIFCNAPQLEWVRYQQRRGALAWTFDSSSTEDDVKGT